MKIIHFEFLIRRGPFQQSKEWTDIEKDIRKSIKSVVWPPGKNSFLIYPQSGKKRGEGSGVKPIKEIFCAKLKQKGWSGEVQINITDTKKPGPIDMTKEMISGQYFAVEWETGNISSSHRALNKMALGMMKNLLKGGILVLPTRSLAKYLTDRIGNYEELEPFFPLWQAIPCRDGILAVIGVEHDGISEKVPRIKKGTDGRALL